MTRARSSQKGFTLLETIIAMVIMAGALLLLVNSWGGTFMRLRQTQMKFEIASLIERKMNDVELQYRGKSLDEIPESKEDNFGDDYPQYTWKLESKKLEFPDFSSALTSKEGGADQMLISVIKQMGEMIGKAVKEVTVTVTFKAENKAPVTYNVTTWFVDYNQAVSIGMPGG